MIAAALVLRPEPGNAQTAARLESAGVRAVRQPLFGVAALPWAPPDAAGFDALMLTSANAARYAGAGLAALVALPVVAVGEATAGAARAAGLTVALTGEGDAAKLAAAARMRGYARLLHLAGRDRAEVAGATAIPVYASDALPIARGAARAWEGQVALLHSARAARWFAALVDRDGADRSRITLAAIGPAVLKVAGDGWRIAAAAERPTDAGLVALAAALIDPASGGVDKPIQ